MSRSVEREALFDALRRLAPIGAEALDAVARLTIRRSFEDRSYLLRGGEVAEWCFFVERGLVRELYVDDEGCEYTRSFIAERQVTGSLLDLLSPEPSITWIQALEPTTTLAFRYRDFDALTERFPEMHRVSRRHAEALYVKKTRREHEMLALSASARHARWLAEHPGLDARVSRKHLASYLGITPEHLSRLRASPARPLMASRRSKPPKGAR